MTCVTGSLNGVHQAQRECCEAYIQSQRPEGWTLLPQHYDDGGFTGANLNRPALQQLLADIESGSIQAVVIYKVDRLSRSLFDFARVMQIFDKHGVSFVSVTQQLNSRTPMGRLTLHVLLSFAQFEREIISDRTRDKISAARRKGKWMGGYPVLGYDPDPRGTRLVVNEAEAAQVREIFALFLRHGALIPTLEEIEARGWRMKSWITRQGQSHAGGAFNRPALVRLLTNVLYTGAVKHHGEIYAGEQPAIVEPQIWQQANDLLRQPNRGREMIPRNGQGALLKDLLVCAVCGSRMVPSSTHKQGRRYPYYVCLRVQKRGASACPGQRVAAHRIESAVVNSVHTLSEQPGQGALHDALTVDATGWGGLERAAQHGILRMVIDHVRYAGRSEEAILQLRAGLAGKRETVTVTLRIQRKALVEQSPPPVEQKPAVAAVVGRLPRITRLMALAVRFEELLREGVVQSYAELAQLGGVSRARITQILNLRNLAPPIQEQLLLVHPGSGVNPIPERALRGLTASTDWRRQMRLFDKLARCPARMQDPGRPPA